MKAAREDSLYLQARGLRVTSPKILNEALRLALEDMQVTLYGEAKEELTAAEQTVLRKGGLVLDEQPGRDPLADTVAKYAALIESSLSTAQASKRLGFGAGRIRQMVADRSLYSVLLEGRRFIPTFQFLARGKRLVPDIGRVNSALDSELHPVEIYNWYTAPNPDLYLDDDVARTVSPLDWLKSGRPIERVVRLAETL